jgi:hypothetical protein
MVETVTIAHTDALLYAAVQATAETMTGIDDNAVHGIPISAYKRSSTATTVSTNDQWRKPCAVAAAGPPPGTYSPPPYQRSGSIRCAALAAESRPDPAAR